MRLALFYTFNMSVDDWVKAGLLDREKLIYEEHIKNDNLDKVYWFTYGIHDGKFVKNLKGIQIIPMSKIFNFKIGKLFYSLLIPVLYGKILQKVDVFKTNQMPGSWSAVLAKIIYRKPLILRTGWTWSLFVKERMNTFLSLPCLMITLIEKFAYKFCDYAEVSSKFQKKYLIEKYKIQSDKIHILPNYIDINIFRNKRRIEKRKNEFLFIGRLEEQKNLFNLIKAVAKIDMRLIIYGDGSLKKSLKKYALRLKINVVFKNRIANKRLPDIYNQYKYFILPSLYEGNPKTLLEAMSCGCICIGTNVNGIKEIIKPGYNGILIKGTNSTNIYDKLTEITKLNDKKVYKIIKYAVETVRIKFSISEIIKLESKIFHNIVTT